MMTLRSRGHEGGDEMPYVGALYDDGGTEANLNVIVDVHVEPTGRSSGVTQHIDWVGIARLELRNADDRLIWSVDHESPGPTDVRVRVDTGIGTQEIPLTLLGAGWNETATVFQTPGYPPAQSTDYARTEVLRVAELRAWPGPPHIVVPPTESDAAATGLRPTEAAPARPHETFTVTYLAAVPNRTAPFHPTVLGDLRQLNDLACAALATQAQMLESKAARDFYAVVATLSAATAAALTALGGGASAQPPMIGTGGTATGSPDAGTPSSGSGGGAGGGDILSGVSRFLAASGGIAGATLASFAVAMTRAAAGWHGDYADKLGRYRRQRMAWLSVRRQLFEERPDLLSAQNLPVIDVPLISGPQV
jgi:hypothetical protein